MHPYKIRIQEYNLQAILMKALII